MVSVSAKNLINFDFDNFYEIFSQTSSSISAEVVNEITASLLSDVFVSLNWDDDFVFINKPYLSTLGYSLTLSVPDTVTDVCSESFSGCENICRVYLPPSVSAIHHHAFEGCKTLSYINTDSIKYLGEYAFDNCTSLSSCQFNQTGIFIGQHAFDDCQSLRKITFGNVISIEFPNFCGATCEECCPVQIPMPSAPSCRQIALSQPAPGIPRY